MLNKEKNAYTLVEVVVAISILSVGVLSLMSLFSNLATYQRKIDYRDKAIYFSQNAFEGVRSRLETNLGRCESNQDLWRCATEGIDPCTCKRVAGGDDQFFGDIKNFYASYDGLNWDFKLEDGVYVPPLWSRIYYNCPPGGNCYYSCDDIGGGNSTETPFERKMVVENNHDYDGDSLPDMIQISSVIRWREDGQYKYVTTSSEFYNWQWVKNN